MYPPPKRRPRRPSGDKLKNLATEVTDRDCSTLSLNDEDRALNLLLKNASFYAVRLIEQEFGYLPGRLYQLWKAIQHGR